MNDDKDLGRKLEAWLSEGPTEAPATVIRGVLVAFPRTARRGRRAPLIGTGGGRWLLAASMAMVAALIGLATVLWSPDGVGTIRTSPLPSASPTTTVDPSRISTVGWTSFTSPRFGYSLSHPEGWIVTAATSSWTAGRTPSSFDGNLDKFKSDGTDGFLFFVASQPIAAGVDDATWLREHQRRSGLLDACSPPPERMERTTVAGQTAYVSGDDVACRFFEAIFFVDGRVYWLRGTGFADPGQGPPFDRAHFDAFLSTVRFHPASADDLTSLGTAAVREHRPRSAV
jgi:hypothetical protein